LTVRGAPCYPTGVVRAVTAAIALVLAVGPASPARGDPHRWSPVPGKSEVSFVAAFPLGNFTGRTQDVTGEFRADPADLRQGVTGHLVVAARGLRTGDDGRDRDMYKALAAQAQPDIRFTIERVEASFPSVTERADVLLSITGVMLIRGVERSMVFPARVRLRDDKLWVRGEAEVKMTDFGIKPPSHLMMDVKNQVLVSFDVLLTPEP